MPDQEVLTHELRVNVGGGNVWQMIATAHVEVEDKYTAEESLRLPALVGLPSVARVGQPEEFTLEATYVDTTDLRLAARGMTLRRRTGGTDAGWHLKLPIADGSRQEIRRPLDRSRSARPPVPAALLRLVRAHVRDAELIPLVRLKTRRTVHRLYGSGDQLLAEVADDQVTAEILGDELTVTTWREIEVELVNGERDLLAAAGELLAQAGAEPAPTASKLAHALGDRLPPDFARPHPPGWPKPSSAGFAVLAYLREQVDALIGADAAVREERHDSVHKMRVATRRMRSVLATYRPLFDEPVTEPLRAELKWLGGVLGAVRDAEVMHRHLDKALGDLPKDLLLGPVRTRVDTELKGAYRQARKQLLSELDGTRYFRLLDDLDVLICTPPLTPLAAKPARTVLPRRVGRERRRLDASHEEASHAAAGVRTDHPLHEVRKAAKRARYAGEAAAPTVGRPAERFVEAVTELQQTLGVHQDTIVLRDSLRRMGAQAFLAGESGFTFGLLHGLEQGRADRAERDFEAAWKAAARGAVNRWLR